MPRKSAVINNSAWSALTAPLPCRTAISDVYSQRGKKLSRLQYDYRTHDGEPFPAVAPTLREFRQKRDKQLAK